MYRLHYHQHGRENVSEHTTLEDAVQFARSGEMADALSADYVSDDAGAVVLHNGSLTSAVWGID